MPSEANPAVRGAFPTMGRFWTAANVLSLTRGALAVPIALLVYRGGPVGPLVGLVAFAIATDFLDGKLARWSRTVSEWGKVLDATADKLAAAGVHARALDTAGRAQPAVVVCRTRYLPRLAARRRRTVADALAGPVYHKPMVG